MGWCPPHIFPLCAEILNKIQKWNRFLAEVRTVAACVSYIVCDGAGSPDACVAVGEGESVGTECCWATLMGRCVACAHPLVCGPSVKPEKGAPWRETLLGVQAEWTEQLSAILDGSAVERSRRRARLNVEVREQASVARWVDAARREAGVALQRQRRVPQPTRTEATGIRRQGGCRPM
jgi:hypothetical protein